MYIFPIITRCRSRALFPSSSCSLFLLPSSSSSCCSLWVPTPPKVICPVGSRRPVPTLARPYTHTHTHPSWSYPVVLCATLTKKEEKFLVALQAYPLYTIEFGSVYKSDQWTFLAESSISLSGARRRRSHKPKKFIEHFPVGLLHSHTHTVTFGERTGATSFTYL